MKEIIFWGATGQAKVLRECLEKSGEGLVALFDNNNSLKSPFEDIPLYYGKKGFEAWMKQKKKKDNIGCLVAIGGDKGKERIEIQEYLESWSLIPMIARHSTAFVAKSARIGAGAQILAQAAICVDAIVGRGCIINTGATVDHESCLGDGVHVCPGAHLAGCVDVGSYTMIGTGAVVLPRVKIGQGVIVGAGSVVLEDVPSDTVVVGNPARALRKVKNG